jgi:peptidoglycan hydrolase-like protein with peptidoglycan-binding domain
MELPRVTTPISLSTAEGLLLGALTNRLAAPPSKEVASLLLAQLWIESGRGASSKAHALGNLMAAGFADGVEHFVWSGDYSRPSWYANTSHALHSEMLAGRQPSAFRAYSNFADSIADYVKLVLSPKYAQLMQAARTGNPHAFASAISSTGYTSQMPPGMGDTFAGLLREFAAKGVYASLPKAPSGTAPMEPASPVSPSPHSRGSEPGGGYVVVRGEIVSLHRGAYGAMVAIWQKLAGLPVTGEFDAETLSGTLDWQTARGLQADGVVDPMTWTKAISS